MLAEESVPFAHRVLFAEGIVDETLLPGAVRALMTLPSPSGRVLFLTFTYADLPLGKEFSFTFPRDCPLDAVATRAVLTAVTQQFFEPWDALPHGWKTICLVEFPDGVPEIVDQLPLVSSWYESALAQHVCFANPDALAALRSVGPAGGWD